MGNLCSKSANEPEESTSHGNNFNTAGRVLGSGGQGGPSSTPVPQKVTVSPPERTVGSREGADTPSDAKREAARAAEERASKGTKPGGKLSSQLAAQKKQTQNQLLNERSTQESRIRDSDQNFEARNWN